MPNNPMNESHTPLIEHLVALRKCLIQSFVIIMFIFCALFYFANDLYHLLALPLINHLPQGANMIATHVIAPVFVPLKFTLVLAVFLAIPFIFYQVWKFIAPGLYQQEKNLLWLILSASTFLFYAGILFAYFFVCPLLFNVLTHMAPAGIVVMPDMSQFLDFILRFFFAFGLAFEVPVIMFLLVKTGISTVDSLSNKRRYFIVAAFIIAMFLTPPDVLSQITLAIPLCLLYEIGLIACRLLTLRTATRSYNH